MTAQHVVLYAPQLRQHPVAHGLQGVTSQHLLPGPGAHRGGLVGVLVHVSQQLHQVAVFGLCPLVPSPTPGANTTHNAEN
jgi:hypothetical protein